MPSDFDDLLAELTDAGLDDSYIERLKKATAGSPLRKERDEFKQKNDELTERLTKAEAKVLETVFDKVKKPDITLKLNALRIPDDLDVLDEKAVREWAVAVGVADPPEPDTPADEAAAHERIQAAATGAGAGESRTTIKPEDTAEWSTDKLVAFKQKHPEAFEALKRGEPVSGITW